MKTVSLKKTVFLTIALAIMFSTNVTAQVWHGMYTSNTDNLMSLINVSNPNTYETWLVATDDNNKVVVMNLGVSALTPTPASTIAFNVPNAQTPIGQIYLKSGFFDPAGNIFAYGWEETQKRGVMMKITIINGVATGLICSNLIANDTPIEDACWANTFNPTPTTNPICYGIIAGNKFIRIYVNTITNMFVFSSAITSASNEYYESVFYDDTQNTFFVSGSKKGNFANNLFYWSIPNNTVSMSITGGKDFQFSPQSTFGSRIVRSGQDCYIIALMDHGFVVVRYNYYTSTLISSRKYELNLIYPDMISMEGFYDFKIGNGYLYALGYHRSAVNSMASAGKFIAEIDMNSPFGGNIMLMGDVDFTGTTPYYYWQRYLSCLNYNYASTFMCASGADINGDAYFLEIMGAAYSICNYNVNVIDYPLSPNSINSIIVNQNTTSVPLTPRTNITQTIYSVSETFLCFPSPNPKSAQQKEEFTNKMTIDKEIIVMENMFIVNNFDGNCKFKIMDILGKTIQEGYTQNGTINNINIPQTGIYIIHVIDETNYTQHSKIFIEQ